MYHAWDCFVFYGAMAYTNSAEQSGHSRGWRNALLNRQMSCTSNILQRLLRCAWIMPTHHDFFFLSFFLSEVDDDWGWHSNIFQFWLNVYASTSICNDTQDLYLTKKRCVRWSFVCFSVTPKQTKNRVAGKVVQWFTSHQHQSIYAYMKHLVHVFLFLNHGIYSFRSFLFLVHCLRTWLATKVYIYSNSCASHAHHSLCVYIENEFRFNSYWSQTEIRFYLHLTNRVRPFNLKSFRGNQINWAPINLYVARLPGMCVVLDSRALLITHTRAHISNINRTHWDRERNILWSATLCLKAAQCPIQIMNGRFVGM